MVFILTVVKVDDLQKVSYLFHDSGAAVRKVFAQNVKCLLPREFISYDHCIKQVKNKLYRAGAGF